MKQESTALVHETGARVKLVAGAAATLWAIEILDKLVFFWSFDGLGVVPRTAWGLVGVALAPFLHVGFGHLIANTVPLLVLGFLASGRKLMDFWVVSVVSALTAGLGCWLFGAAGSVHLGASGVIFGYLGFLMGRGLFDRKLGNIALSVAVTVLFGGSLVLLLPIFAGISWQAHLFGWLGGLLTAKVLGGAIAEKERRR